MNECDWPDQFLAELTNGFEERRPSMSPTVPPISQRRSRRRRVGEDEIFDRVVTCGITWTCAEIIAAAFLGDDVLVDAAVVMLSACWALTP